MLYAMPPLYRVRVLLQVLILDVVDELGAQWRTSLPMQREGRGFGRLA